MINSTSDKRLLKLLLGGLGFCLIFIALVLSVISSGNTSTSKVVANPSISPSQPQPTTPTIVSPVETKYTAIPTLSKEPIDYALTDEIKGFLPIELNVLVKEVNLLQPGSIEISTSIIDPRGDNGSMQAQQALAICDAAVAQGYTYVAIKENDGTHYALFGHALYPGGFCSEV